MTGPDLFDMLLRVHGAEELGRQYVFVRLARMNIAGHIDYSETSRILERIRRRSDWFTEWMSASDRHAAMAVAAAHRNANSSAGDAYLRASLCAHWASLYARGNDKTDAHRRSLELYQAGSAWYEPPVERVEIDFDGDALPGYVRGYGEGDPRPLLIMLGGADTNKEELHHWGTQFTRRGLVVLVVDGPGQGEHSSRYGRLTMRFDRYHHAVSAIVDWAQRNLPHVEHSKTGLFGNSLGGYLALDAAMRDPRIGAVISNGGFCDAASIDQWPAGVMQAFASCLGIQEIEAIRSHIASHLDLSAVPAKHYPPALVVHGGREDLTDEDESRRAAQIIQGTLTVIEDGWHTCTNRDHLLTPLMTDWMSSALAGRIRPGFREVHLSDELGYQALLEAATQ